MASQANPRQAARRSAVAVVPLVAATKPAAGPVTAPLGGTITSDQVLPAPLFPGIYSAGWLLARRGRRHPWNA
jgi:hypothetical protein